MFTSVPSSAGTPSSLIEPQSAWNVYWKSEPGRIRVRKQILRYTMAAGVGLGKFAQHR